MTEKVPYGTAQTIRNGWVVILFIWEPNIEVYRQYKPQSAAPRIVSIGGTIGMDLHGRKTLSIIFTFIVRRTSWTITRKKVSITNYFHLKCTFRSFVTIQNKNNYVLGKLNDI